VILGLVSQKGGVGKSTLARALAVAATQAGIRARIADLDPQQVTVSEWQERREEGGVEPPVTVGAVVSAAEAIGSAHEGDQLLIIDGPARTSQGTLDISRQADLIVQPVGAGYDDLDPAIRLFHELVRVGIPREKLVIALSRIATAREDEFARRYIGKLGFRVLPGSIPEKASFREAHDRGLAITEAAHGALKGQVDEVVNAVFERLAALMRAKVVAENQKVRGQLRS
jgi:chromosome partitioning protein